MKMDSIKINIYGKFNGNVNFLIIFVGLLTTILVIEK